MDAEMDRLVEAQDEPHGRHTLLEEGLENELSTLAESTGYLPGSDDTGSPRASKRHRPAPDPDTVTNIEAPGIPSQDPFAPLTAGPPISSTPPAVPFTGNPALEFVTLEGEGGEEPPDSGLAARARAAEADKGYESDVEPEPAKFTESDSGIEAPEGGEPHAHKGLRKFEEEANDENGSSEGTPAGLEIHWGTSSHTPQKELVHEVLCHVTQNLEPTTRGMTAPGFKDSLRRSLALLAASHGAAGLTAEEAVERIPTVLSRAAAVFEPPGKVAEAAAEDNITRALELAFLAAETEAMTEAASSGINPGGAVAVAALQVGQVVYIANVGDNGVALIKPNAVERLTRVHIPEDPRETERIETQGGSVRRIGEGSSLKVISNEGKEALGVTRALGDPQFKEQNGRQLLEPRPDIREVDLSPDNTALVLATHNVWAAMGEDGVGQVVREVYGGWLESGHDVTKQAAVCVADAVVQAARAAGALGPCVAIAGVLSWT